MIEQIDSVLEILDGEKDHLLIELLKQKKETKVKISKFEFDSNNAKTAKSRINNVLYNAKEELLSNYPAYGKIRSILERFGCYECPFGVTTYINGYNTKRPNKERIGCKRCSYKKEKFYDYLENLETSIDKTFESLVTNELIDTYTLIFIIEKKLKELKTK